MASDSARSLRAAIAYGGAAALQRALMFLMLPVFTAAMSPTGYGEVSVALAASGLAVAVLALGQDLAVFRGYVAVDADHEQRDALVRGLWVCTLAVALAVALGVSGAGAVALDGNSVLDPLQFCLAMVGAALFVGATVVPLAVLRAQERLSSFVAINALSGVLTTAGIYVGVVAFDGGTTGWLVGIFVANALVLAASVAIVPFRPGAIDGGVIRQGLSLGLPMVPHYAAIWALNLADRLVLVHVSSAAQVGIYSLAANVAVPVLVGVQAINQGFMPQYARAGGPGRQQEGLQRTIEIQVSAVSVITLTVALLGPSAVLALIDQDFSAAATLVPPLALGFGLLGLYYIPVNIMSLTQGQTRGYWKVTILAALVNLSSVALLVPAVGLSGAAWAAVAGYGVLAVGVFAYRQRAFGSFPYPWRPSIRAVVLSTIVYSLTAVSTDPATVAGIVLRTGVLVATAGTLLALARRPQARGGPV